MRFRRGMARRAGAAKIGGVNELTDEMARSLTSMNSDRAATLALEALAFLAVRQETFERFADLSGLDPATVSARAAEVEFLVSVLDFILADEQLLLDFCENGSSDPRALHVARHVLGGP